jgi:hypothetical protein
MAHSLCKDDRGAEIDGSILPIAGVAIKPHVKTCGWECSERWLWALTVYVGIGAPFRDEELS